MINVGRIIVIVSFAFAFLFGVIECDSGRWAQFGNIISFDSLGGLDIDYLAISGDGTTVIVCEMLFGRTLVYKFNAISRQWEQLINPFIPGGGDGDVTISNDGSTVAVISNTFVESSGISFIRVFKFVGRDWEQVGSDLSVDVTNGNTVEDIELSGDGTTLLIDSGDIKAFRLNSATSEWVHLGAVVTDFGASAMNANSRTIVDTLRYNSTLLRLSAYRYQPTHSRWQQLGSNIDVPAINSDYFGDVVISADGTTIAFAKLGNSSTGIVQVYKYQPPLSRWVKMGVDFTGSALDIGFGSTITLSGDGSTVAIGVGRQNAGRILVYKFSPSTSRWLQLGSNTSTTINLKKIAMSNNGSRIAVGAPRNEIAVYQFNAVVQPPTCNVTWNLYNSRSDQLIGHIRNGTVFTRPPPCNLTNIEAIIPSSPSCTIPNNRTMLKLYSQDMLRLIVSRNETGRYFLFGNNGSDIRNGKIVPGTYNLQVNVNGWNSPLTRFTLQSNGSC